MMAVLSAAILTHTYILKLPTCMYMCTCIETYKENIQMNISGNAVSLAHTEYVQVYMHMYRGCFCQMRSHHKKSRKESVEYLVCSKIVLYDYVQFKWKFVLYDYYTYSSNSN